MSSTPSGVYRSLSLNRRWVCDLVSLSQSIPIAALEHRLYLKPLAEARAALTGYRPGWVALFMKAFAIVAARRPYLRRSYVAFPWPRLYEHPQTVAAVTVERVCKNENAIFFEMLEAPESLPILELHQRLRRLKSDPLESFATFRRLLWTSRLPRPIRFLIWRYYYSFSGPRRAKNMGTFAINGGTRLPIRPVTIVGAIGTTLYFGLFDEAQSTDVCLTFDHRVMDGGDVVRALDEIEAVMNTDLTIELRALEKSVGAIAGKCA